MIAANRIIYNELSSLDFDLIVDVAFDSDNGGTTSFLNRDAVASESYNGHFRRVHNYKYNEVFSPKFTFVKKDFSEFSFEEQERVLSWLTSKTTPSFLTVYYDDSEVISWEALGGWVEIETYKTTNRQTIGIQAVFEATTPWALSPLYTIIKNVSNPTDSTITIHLETDDPQSAVYPRITIQQDNSTNVIKIGHVMTDTDDWVEGSVFYFDGNYYWIDAQGEKHTSAANTSNFETTSVSIRNICTDDKGAISVFNTLVKNNIKGETVVLDGANRVISNYLINDSGKETIGTRIFGNDFSWNWTPLYKGKNELSFVGNCTVTIEYRCPIKCGEF